MHVDIYPHNYDFIPDPQTSNAIKLRDVPRPADLFIDFIRSILPLCEVLLGQACISNHLS